MKKKRFIGALVCLLFCTSCKKDVAVDLSTQIQHPKSASSTSNETETKQNHLVNIFRDAVIVFNEQTTNIQTQSDPAQSDQTQTNQTQTNQNQTNQTQTNQNQKQSNQKKSNKNSNNQNQSNQSSGSQQSDSDGYFDIEQGKQILALINQERRSKGIPELKWDNTIYQFACKRAKEIRTNFSHEGCGDYGENIYMSSGNVGAEKIHDGYYNSPPHHENYLRDSYDIAAVAVWHDANGGTYCAENFDFTFDTSGYYLWNAPNGVKLYVKRDGNSFHFKARNCTEEQLNEAVEEWKNAGYPYE